MTEVRPATRASKEALCRLRVAPDQDGLVAPNDVTFQQAETEGGSEVYGLYQDQTPVGLLAVIDTAHPMAALDEGDPADAIYVWRLMVDARFQRGGHGMAALTFADRLAQARGRGSVFLSVVPSGATALPFYEAAGFRPTGRVIDGEVEMSKPVRGR